MNNYYILNLETEKLELHFEKDTYKELSDEKRSEIKSNFVWGRKSGCWISRAKYPHLHFAEKCAESIGLTNAGRTGERLSFAEQMEIKTKKAERRADRFECRSDAAIEKARALQKPINDMCGDIAFFTQPNINSSAGRAFTNRRNRMFAAFEKGFEEFNRSEYWKERANVARSTASMEELKDISFVYRRIEERKKNIRKIKKSVDEFASYVATYQSGSVPVDMFGTPVRFSEDKARETLDYYMERLEIELDKLGFYQDCLDNLGGIKFSKKNIKPGYIVNAKRWGCAEVVSTGPKNCIIKDHVGCLRISYPEIIEVLKKPGEETEEESHVVTLQEYFESI